jgi:hypothetical protein
MDPLVVEEIGEQLAVKGRITSIAYMKGILAVSESSGLVNLLLAVSVLLPFLDCPNLSPHIVDFAIRSRLNLSIRVSCRLMLGATSL